MFSLSFFYIFSVVGAFCSVRYHSKPLLLKGDGRVLFVLSPLSCKLPCTSRSEIYPVQVVTIRYSDRPKSRYMQFHPQLGWQLIGAEHSSTLLQKLCQNQPEHAPFPAPLFNMQTCVNGVVCSFLGPPQYYHTDGSASLGTSETDISVLRRWRTTSCPRSLCDLSRNSNLPHVHIVKARDTTTLHHFSILPLNSRSFRNVVPASRQFLSLMLGLHRVYLSSTRT
jgi:hypothetical protein